MKILVIAAHPDDEAIGMGGTIKKHSNEGDEVFVCMMSRSVMARSNKPEDTEFMKNIKMAQEILGIKDIMFFDFPNIKMNSVPHLEMVQAIEEAITKFRPEMIYTHHKGDLNVDHRSVYEATMAALRLPQRDTEDLPIDLIKKVYCYEVISSTEWNADKDCVFVPNYFVNIEEEYEDKIKAIESYKGVMRKFPHPRSIEGIDATAKYRGIQAGFKRSEGFVLVREIK